MLLTAAITLILLGALLSGLRTGFYALHVILVCGGAYGYATQYGDAALFSPQAGWVVLVIHLLSITLLTFTAYGYDKWAARNGRWRVRERSLHALSLIGGTFGAFAAQKVFRHKTRKTSFRIVFWITGWLQLVLLYTLWVMSR
jgi:uncharacterized membrane protein YsdA (DUF1294 family)